MKTISHMYRLTLSIFLVLSCLCTSSCQLFTSHSSDSAITVGYCVDILGPENDSYNTPILNCLKSLENEERIRLTIQQSTRKEQYQQDIQSIAKNHSIVFCTPLMQEECLQSSLLYPTTHFIVVDAYPFHPDNMILPETSNITFLLFSEEEIAEIAGYIAAHMDPKKPSALYFPGSRISPLKNRVYNRYVKGFRRAAPSSENCIECFTKEDVDEGTMNNTMERLGVGSIFYFPGLYYASLVDDATVLSDTLSFPCWSLFLLGDEQAAHPFLGGILRKNYASVVSFVIAQYEQNASQLEPVMVCTRKENAFLFTPGLYSFSDSSLVAINAFLHLEK